MKTKWHSFLLLGLSPLLVSSVVACSLLSPGPSPAPAPLLPQRPVPVKPVPVPTRISSKANIEVHFIDVGQGDSILIDSGDTEILIDGGDRTSGVVTYLEDFVDGALEVMVATHSHADHIGGLVQVLDTYEVEEIWLNGDAGDSEFMLAVGSEGAQVYKARRGDTIKVGGLAFNVLHPVSLNDTVDNNSIVLRFSYGDVDFLFMGDVGHGAEASMLRAGIVPVVDILKIGDHGSSNASSESFLKAVRASLAIYMAGKGNRYGYPHNSTLAILAEAKLRTYGTDNYGTIIITTNGKTFSLSVNN
ncbi:ComEC/Rec2 family competence protein [Chloroflexota bacterium]